MTFSSSKPLLGIGLAHKFFCKQISCLEFNLKGARLLITYYLLRRLGKILQSIYIQLFNKLLLEYFDGIKKMNCNCSTGCCTYIFDFVGKSKMCLRGIHLLLIIVNKQLKHLNECAPLNRILALPYGIKSDSFLRL